MGLNSVQASIEAILFAAGAPVPLKKLSFILQMDEELILNEIQGLKKYYEDNNHSLVILHLSDKIQLCTLPEYANIISLSLEQRRPAPLSKAALEVLAIVAYFQPVTRAYIEKMRGVDSTFTVNSLLEKDLIKEDGKLETPGRPSLLVTTDNFLRIMGIQSCDELPKIRESIQDEV